LPNLELSQNGKQVIYDQDKREKFIKHRPASQPNVEFNPEANSRALEDLAKQQHAKTAEAG
jgi:phosphopantetheine adenylyltransferase